MSGAPYKAPNGREISGILLRDEAVCSIAWHDDAKISGRPEYSYAGATPSGCWQGVEYLGCPVFVDKTDDEWFRHHLLLAEESPVEPAILAAMRQEVDWRKRAAMLFNLAETFGDDTNAVYWRGMAEEWANRADEIAFSHGWMARSPVKLRAVKSGTVDGVEVEEGDTFLMVGQPLTLTGRVTSAHYEKLSEHAAEAMLVRMAVDNTTWFDPQTTKLLFERVTALLAETITTLQAEASKGDLT